MLELVFYLLLFQYTTYKLFQNSLENIPLQNLNFHLYSFRQSFIKFFSNTLDLKDHFIIMLFLYLFLKSFLIKLNVFILYVKLKVLNLLTLSFRPFMDFNVKGNLNLFHYSYNIFLFSQLLFYILPKDLIFNNSFIVTFIMQFCLMLF